MKAMIKGIEPKVKYILSKHPEAREDDRILYQFYLIYTQQGRIKNNKIDIRLISIIPNMDTLGRARRKLQENGFFLPPDDIKQRRKEREERIKEEMKK